MNVCDAVPAGWRKTGLHIKGFLHTWEPVLPDTPDAASTLPPPFDAYGVSKWLKISCDASHSGSCQAYTLDAASKAATRIPSELAKMNVLLGVSRNKRLAKLFRESKRVEEVEEDEEVNEVKDIKDVKPESESESEESESSTEQGDGESYVSDESE